MKAIQTNSNYDDVRKAIGIALTYLNDSSLVFIDTNILTWLYRLNEDSFKEFKKLLNDLIDRNSLVIPNWVVHEYNNLLISNSEEIFFPYKRRIKAFDKELEYLSAIGKLAVDNELPKKNGYINKKEFINQLTEEINSIRKKIKLITDKNNIKHEKRREYIERIILKSQSSVSVDKISKMEPQFQFRLDNNIPPGFKDKTKESNKYGDIIIWHEIIENCKIREIKNALFISLDVKIDWVFKPDKVILDGKELFNNSNNVFYFLHPWLQEEFKANIDNGNVVFSDISGIVDVLYSPDMNPIAFEEFKNLAKTVDIELKNSETNKVIEWLIMNGHKLHYLRTEVCYYKSNPGDVDIEDLKKWCTTNINHNIDFSQVDWGNVFMNLFI